MTQDEIIEMLKESDLDFLLGDNWMLHDELVAFAKLVAAKEREACAKLVDYWESREGEHADAIRARGKQA